MLYLELERQLETEHSQMMYFVERDLREDIFACTKQRDELHFSPLHSPHFFQYAVFLQVKTVCDPEISDKNIMLSTYQTQNEI